MTDHLNPLLEQFLLEARELLELVGQKLLRLETTPGDVDGINELFRLVHTLKGNSGLFAFSELTRVLHAGEDVMGLVRSGELIYSETLADPLLNAMDFVGRLCDEIEHRGSIDASHASEAVEIARALRKLMPGEREGTARSPEGLDVKAEELETERNQNSSKAPVATGKLGTVPEASRMMAFRACEGTFFWISMKPREECFFDGDDPFHIARGTPDLIWGAIRVPHAFPQLEELDLYSSKLHFEMLSVATGPELLEYFRYILDQVVIEELPVEELIFLSGSLLATYGTTDCVPLPSDQLPNDFAEIALAIYDAGDSGSLLEQATALLGVLSAETMPACALRWLLVVLDCCPENRDLVVRLLGELSVAEDHAEEFNQGGQSPAASFQFASLTPVGASPPVHAADTAPELASVLEDLCATQLEILRMQDRPAWQQGRLRAVAAVLSNLERAAGVANIQTDLGGDLDGALRGNIEPLIALADMLAQQASSVRRSRSARRAQSANRLSLTPAVSGGESAANCDTGQIAEIAPERATERSAVSPRRAETPVGSTRMLKVDQGKIDRLMNLIGELIVSKNALPYLAQRAEGQYGVRDLSREIKSQHTVINRIADEMQDAIMGVRMMAVSSVFQRFPRLVRDLSKKLGKEVQLVLEGEQTEADKSVIEALADPLIHMVRNSLDHGLETPEARQAAGKPRVGTLTIRASQEADRVLIEIVDDGRGIDPAVIKRKAFERGILDQYALERIGDQEAVNLIFAAGLSTAEVISDLSGRGVGMDVVRSAVERINGSVLVESEVGKGTSLRISLPLSMAVTHVMVVESDNQLFGVPIDHVLETVRISNKAVRTIKKNPATVMRGRVVPLKALNELLGLKAKPKLNAEQEIAVLLVRWGSEVVGLIVDGFRESVGLIQKPLSGMLAGLTAYSGSALLGDGSVLMILNIREIL